MTRDPKIARHLAAWVHVYLRLDRFTEKQLAHRAGITLATLRAVAGGKVNARTATILGLRRAFDNMSLDRMLLEDPPKSLLKIAAERRAP